MVINGEIIPLDFESYSLEEDVLWSGTFTNPKENILNGLTIVVKGHWMTKEYFEENNDE